MTDAQRASVGMTLAGKNQFRVLSAIMTNFSHATEATQTALNSQGSAMQENSKYMESIEARTAAFNSALQELSQTVISNDLIKGVIDLGTGFLRMANTDIGGSATRIGLLTTALGGLFGVLKAGNYLGMFGQAFSGIIGGLTVGKVMAVVAAIGLLVEGIKVLNDYLKEKQDAKFLDTIDSKVKESQQKIDEYNGKISDASTRLTELNKIPFENRTDDIDFEIAKLESLIKQYERLKQEEQEVINKKYLKQFRKSGVEDGSFTISALDIYGLERQVGTTAFEQTRKLEEFAYSNKQLEALTAQYGNVTDAALALASAFDVDIEESDTLDSLLEKLAGRGIYLEKSLKSVNDVITESQDEFRRYNAVLGGSTQVSKEIIESSKGVLTEYEKVYNVLSSANFNDLTLQEQEFVRNYEEMRKALERQTLGVDNINAAKDALASLFDEAAKSGLSAETLSLEEYVSTLSKIETIDSRNLDDVLNYLKSIGFIDLEYTDEQLQEIINKTFRLDGTDVDVEFDAETEAIDDALGAVQELAAQGVSVAGTTDAQALIDAIGVLKEQIAQLNAQHITINISTNIDKVLSSTSDLRKSLNNLPSPNISITGNVSEVASVLSNIISLSGRTVKINIDLRDARTGQPISPSQLQGLGGRATGSNYFGGGPVLINDGAPVNGSAGELVVTDGQAQIYNDGKPTVVNLPRGAKIYTAAETQEILKNSGAVGGVPAFASGTQPSNVNYSNIAYTPSQYYSSTYVKGVSPKKTEESFEKWLKKRKHLLELDKITEEQYYLDLEYMNEKYLSKVTSAQDTYWKYQEQVYKWKKSQIDSENEALEKQIELQEALGNLEKAKSQKILIYKDGKFQYIADPDAIASAQRSVDSLLAKGYADGTLSATGGLRMVGENGPELRVLRSGDGIIPADATKNLLDMAKMGVGGLMGSLEKAAQTFYSFAIDNLSLPNATDAKGLLDGLKNYAYQYSYAK